MAETPEGDDRRAGRRRAKIGGRNGCGCGCTSFLLVLTVGIALSLFHLGLGLGVSVRVPLTDSNLTAAGAIGAKEMTNDALPGYTRDRLGGNQNFINSSHSLTIGPAEGAALFVIGRQDGAPVLDLHIVARR